MSVLWRAVPMPLVKRFRALSRKAVAFSYRIFQLDHALAPYVAFRLLKEEVPNGKAEQG
jgi:hypothetical protein